MDKLCVIQADRDAAAAYIRAGGQRFAEFTANLFERGERDGAATVQAFAAHRIASQAELLAVVEGYLSDCTNDECERCIAARAALSHTKGEGE